MLARRAAPPASSSACERPMRPPTAQAAALGLCCLLAGLPLSPRAARGSPFCGACGNTASNSLRPADDPRPATTGAKSRAPTVNWPGPAAHANPKPWPRWVVLCFRELVEASWTSVCLFLTLHFSLTQAAKAGIAIAASARTVKLWLLQRGAFVLHLSVEHESRSLAFTPWQHKQKR